MTEETFASVVARSMRKHVVREDKHYDSTPIAGPWGTRSEPVMDPIDADGAPAPQDSPVIGFTSYGGSISSGDHAPIFAEQDESSTDELADVPVDPITGVKVVESNNERPKLPFSENGKLVGMRQYPPQMVTRAKREPRNVIVFDEDKPDPAGEISSASGCILL